MRFLADESCDFRVVAALRNAGHDVRAVAELSPGIPDREVIALAHGDRRLVLTEDRDFGRLVYADRMAAGAGVLLIRCPEVARSLLPARIVATVEAAGERLLGSFSVWTPKRLRLRRPYEG